MNNKVHHLGTGYEAHVDDVNGKLIYSLPVESSTVTLNFEFEIKPSDLQILKADIYRYAALYQILHARLQSTFGLSLVGVAKPRTFTQQEFEVVVNSVLHSTQYELDAFIDDQGASVKGFIDKYLKNKTKA